MKFWFRCAAIALSLCCGGGAAYADSAPAKPIVIGGGVPFGYYFGLAGVLCQTVNRRAEDRHVCVNVPNGDSARNLTDINDGNLDFAFVQSDWLLHAVEGRSRFRAAGANDELRSVVSVPAEALTILTRRELGAKVITHLAGRRVGYSLPTNYPYLLMKPLLAEARIDLEASEDSTSEASDPAEQICADKIDVYVTVERHPSGRIESLIARCRLDMISVDPGMIARVVEQRPELTRVSVRGGRYPGVPNGVETLGLQAVLATQSSTPDQTVTRLLEAIFDDGADTESTPMMKRLRGSFRDGIGRSVRIAPLHRAAAAYYKSKGWMP